MFTQIFIEGMVKSRFDKYTVIQDVDSIFLAKFIGKPFAFIGKSFAFKRCTLCSSNDYLT